MEEKLRNIRKRLRLAMNGVISTSMRQKGMNYKLIFGVPIPEIKQIAKEYEPEAGLAQALWEEDVREMKILATLLYPAKQLSFSEALQWAREIPYPEIAEQCCNNLFPEMEKASDLALGLLEEENSLYGRMAGFLLFAQLFKRGKAISEIEKKFFLSFCEKVLHSEDRQRNQWNEKQAAIQALKFFGRQSLEQAEAALSITQSKSEVEENEMKRLYDELSFEFEYYKM